MILRATGLGHRPVGEAVRHFFPNGEVRAPDRKIARDYLATAGARLIAIDEWRGPRAMMSPTAVLAETSGRIYFDGE